MGLDILPYKLYFYVGSSFNPGLTKEAYHIYVKNVSLHLSVASGELSPSEIAGCSYNERGEYVKKNLCEEAFLYNISFLEARKINQIIFR